MRCFALFLSISTLVACGRAPVERDLVDPNPTCAELGGYISYVDVSDWEANALIEWANNADALELESVCGVGPGLAKDIVASRPFSTLEDIDSVPMVGPVTLQEMLGREGHECIDEGSVLSDWCGLDGMCECSDL